MDNKEIKPVNSKWNQSWIFIGRTNAEAPIFWPPDEKSQLIRKDREAGKGWRQEEKGMTEDEMVGWHHWFDGYKFEQAQGVGDGQGSLACCSPWGRKELDMTEPLNWTELKTKALNWEDRFMNTIVCRTWITAGEGNGTPLQYSCLENPRDRGAWWAAVYGVAPSRTRLKRLSSSSSRALLSNRTCHPEENVLYSPCLYSNHSPCISLNFLNYH